MTAASASEENAAQSSTAGFGTKRYRSYVLSALTLIYILNFVDRGLLAVVGPELVPELGISDTQFGLLTGFGFALTGLAQLVEHWSPKPGVVSSSLPSRAHLLKFYYFSSRKNKYLQKW